MKKIGVITIGVLILMLSIQCSVWAASNEATDLADLGLLNDVSDESLEKELTRDVGIAMILKAIGYAQSEADVAASRSYFNDVSGWAAGWAELAYIEGITAGVSEQTFNPGGAMSSRQFIAFMLRALGYETQAAWDDAVILGRRSGIVDNEDDLSATYLTKGEAAIYMYRAMSAIHQKNGISLINNLSESGVVTSIEAEMVGLISSEFEITSKKYDNYKSLTLTFSKAINPMSLTEGIVNVYQNGQLLSLDNNVYSGVGFGEVAIEHVTPQTLRFIFGTAFSKGNNGCRIEFHALQSLNGDVLNGSYDVKMRDSNSPRVESVQATGTNHLEVQMTEPVQMKVGTGTYENIIIDGEPFEGKVGYNYDLSRLILTPISPLAIGDHSIKITGCVDFSGQNMVDYEGTVTLGQDIVKPEILSAMLVDQETVHVIFSEAIDTLEGVLTIRNETYPIEDLKIMGDVLVVIDLEQPLSDVGAITLDSSGVQDLEGNVMGQASVEVKKQSDGIGPTVMMSTIDSDELLLVFNEKVQYVDSLHVYVKEDAKTAEISSIRKVNGSKAVYIITLEETMSGSSNYTVVLKGIKDLSIDENDMPDTELVVGKSDSSKPSIKAINFLGSDKIRVTYSEPMNASTIGNLSAYKFQSADGAAGNLISSMDGVIAAVSADGTYADLTVPGAMQQGRLMILKVRDQSGNLLNDYGTYKSMSVAEVFGASDLSVTMIDNKTVKVTAATHSFANVNAKDFLFRGEETDRGFIYATSAYIDDSDASTVLLTLNTNLSDDGTYLDEHQYLYTDGSDSTTDIYSAPLEILASEALIVGDLVRPEVTAEVNGGKIQIQFSEMVKASGTTETINEIYLVDAEGEKVRLTIGLNLFYAGGGSFSYRAFDRLIIDGLSDGEYTLTISSYDIRDLSNNKHMGIKNQKITIE